MRRLLVALFAAAVVIIGPDTMRPGDWFHPGSENVYCHTEDAQIVCNVVPRDE